jgi:dihydroxy-acid dehydratase
MEFNTIAISDGVTMGTEGMKTSLVSREVIADSIELMVRGHMFDGVVALVACDKTIPGAAMALLRLNIPGVILYGGSILPGKHNGHDISIQDVFEAVGANARGRIFRRGTARHRRPRLSRRGRVRRPVHRQHHGHGDGTDRPAPMGTAAVPQVDKRKEDVARRCGASSWTPCARICARATSARARRSITPSPAWRRAGGSTNAVLHLLAMAREAEVPLSIDDFDGICARTPIFVDIKPAGRFMAADVDKAGGIPVIAKRLVEGNFVDGSAITVTGRTFGEEAADAHETPGRKWCCRSTRS